MDDGNTDDKTVIKPSTDTVLQPRSQVTSSNETTVITRRDDATRIHQRNGTGSTDSISETLPRSSTLSRGADASAQSDANEDAIAGIGQTLNGRFVLEQVLGAGGMGEVYKAKDLRRVEMQDNNPYIALKLLRPEFRAHNKFMIALQRESKKVQTLSHPNIVTVYDFDRDGDSAYISMELLKGKSLDRLIFGKGVGVKQALYIIERMARGLAYAHQQGYVHADFKPGNVFLGDDDSVKILDFGIAQAVIKDKEGYKNVALDENDLSALTPNYASLEMLNGEQPLPVDDVYSLCCVAYELLTGRHPYTKPNGEKISAQSAEQLGLLPPKIDGIPKSYQRVLRKGVALHRKDRFDNAGDFLEACKPKFTRKQLILAIIFSAISIFTYYGIDTWNAEKVPSLSTLEGALAPAADLIREGDSILNEGDIDLAHRFYTQAWNLSNEKNIADASLDKLKRIMDNRIDKVADKLIDEISRDNLDSFRFQQLEIALEFLQADNFGNSDEKISLALKKAKEKQQ